VSGTTIEKKKKREAPLRVIREGFIENGGKKRGACNPMYPRGGAQRARLMLKGRSTLRNRNDRRKGAEQPGRVRFRGGRKMRDQLLRKKKRKRGRKEPSVWGRLPGQIPDKALEYEVKNGQECGKGARVLAPNWSTCGNGWEKTRAGERLLIAKKVSRSDVRQTVRDLTGSRWVNVDGS